MSLEGHTDGVCKVLWHPSEPILYSASIDDSIRVGIHLSHACPLCGNDSLIFPKVWDARTGQCIHTFLGHRNIVLDFAISPDGRTIVTGSDDGTSKVFRN